jgi:hypothetical protein
MALAFHLQFLAHASSLSSSMAVCRRGSEVIQIAFRGAAVHVCQAFAAVARDATSRSAFVLALPPGK